MYKNMKEAYGTDGACMDIYYYQEPDEYTAEDWAASSTDGQTTHTEKHDGIYCAICGTKTYLSVDGSHRRCPNCDDQSVNTNWSKYTTDSDRTYDSIWKVTCSN